MSGIITETTPLRNELAVGIEDPARVEIPTGVIDRALSTSLYFFSKICCRWGVAKAYKHISLNRFEYLFNKAKLENSPSEQKLQFALNTSLMMKAIEHNDSVLIERLIDLGADTESQVNNRGMSPLLYAVSMKKYEAVQAILKKSDIDLNHAFESAIKSGDVCLLNGFLDHINNDPEILKTLDIDNLTPLHAAAVHSLAATKVFIERGIPVDIQPNDSPLADFTPLYFAKNAEIIKSLIDAGANVNHHATLTNSAINSAIDIATFL